MSTGFTTESRVTWYKSQLWPKVREYFPEIANRIPEDICLAPGGGYPSSGARGRSPKIRPCEVNVQWTGSEYEKGGMIIIHPNYLNSPENATKALLFGCGKFIGGARWGAVKIGIEKDDDGTLTATAATQAKIDAILADIGTPPEGYAIPFPVREVQRARLRKYVPSSPTCGKVDANGELLRHPIIRAASDTLSVCCQDCNATYAPV